MKIVANSTPLIELSKIHRLELLRDVYHSIIIPEQVYAEVVIDGVGEPGATEVAESQWILRRAVTNENQVLRLHANTPLDLGECGAIVLAQEIDARQVIIDDRVARRVAMAQGLPVIGTVGVLLIAKARHIIPAVKPLLDELRLHGTRISPKLYRQTLAIAEESSQIR